MFTPCLNSEVRADQLLREHPRTIIQMAETCWYNAAQRPPLYPMPRLPPVAQNYRVLAPSSWDHLIYAYMIESTHICEIFRKVSALYKSGAQLPPPSTASRQFWFMADSVILASPSHLRVDQRKQNSGRGGRIQALPVPEHVCAWIKQRGRKSARRSRPILHPRLLRKSRGVPWRSVARHRPATKPTGT